MSVQIPIEPAPDRAFPAAPAAVGPTDRVAARQLWGGCFQVGENFGQPDGRWFAAIRSDTGDPVCLRASCLETAAQRAPLWEKLLALDSPHLHRPTEVRTGSERVEIWAARPGPSLRAWRAGRAAPDEAELKRFVHQLAA
ncbi:MAG: hypothetical protein HY302_01900, partial [Opitutae bacterium]|nr:hypothetical protein [Opitutae bacterium]